MRPLTLNEKITLKGILAKFGTPAGILARLLMEDAVYFFGRCTGQSIIHYPKWDRPMAK
jgi:hypothetical protein